MGRAQLGLNSRGAQHQEHPRARLMLCWKARAAPLALGISVTELLVEVGNVLLTPGENFGKNLKSPSHTPVSGVFPFSLLDKDLTGKQEL